MRRILACILAFVFMATPAIANEAPAVESKPLHVGVVTWFGDGAVFVAKEHKFFGDTDVDVKVIDDVSALVNAFRSGQLDIISFTSDGAALQYANGMTGKVIVFTDYSVGADGLIASPGITSVSDLKGKTIGYTRAYASHYLLGKILETAGMSMKDVKGIPFDDPGVAAQGMFSGQVDAAVTWEPFLTQAASQKLGTVLATTRDYPKALPNIFVVSEQTLNERPEQVKHFIEGVLKALDLSRTDPQTVSEIIAKGFNLPLEEVVEGMKGLTFVDRQENNAFLCGHGDIPTFPDGFDDAVQFWMKEGTIQAAPQPGETYISRIGCPLFRAGNAH